MKKDITDVNYKNALLGNIERELEKNEDDLFLNYLKLTKSKYMNLIKKPCLPEDLFKEIKLEKIKMPNLAGDKKINKRAFKHFSLNKEYDTVEALLGNKAFLVRKCSRIINVTPNLDQILKKLVYKKACTDIALSLNRGLELDVIGLCMAINSLSEMKYISRIDKKQLTQEEVYEKTLEEIYIIYFLDKELGTKMTGLDMDLRGEASQFLKEIRRRNYVNIINLSHYKEAQVINRKLIKVDGIGEIPLEVTLPETYFKYKVYINTLLVSCYLDDPFEYKIYLDLLFEEGQDKILNR